MKYRPRLLLLIVLAVIAGQGAFAPAQPAAPTPPARAKPLIEVAIAPFRPVGSDAATLWIGEGIQQALIAELSRAPTLRLHPLAIDQTRDGAALAAARALPAHALVVGTFQTTRDEVRATGRVLLVSGATVGVVSSRASLREVFRLQDDLARQVRDLLVAPEPAAPSPGPNTPADSAREPAPPVPFEGSALQRALAEENAGRRPIHPTATATAPPPGGITENPGGWGNPGVGPGGGNGWTGGSSGGGWWGGWGGFGYPPSFYPIYVSPAGSGRPSNPDGHGTSGGAPMPPPSISPPAPPPTRPPLVMPGTGNRPTMPPGTTPP